MNNFSVSLNKAIGALKDKQFELALQTCDELLIIEPNNPDVFHIQALASKMLGDLATAKNRFEKSLYFQKNQPVVLSNFANLLVELKEFELASKKFEKAILLTPDHMDAWLNWVLMYIKIENYDLAISTAKNALAINNKEQRILNALGQAYKLIENYNHALSTYDKTLTVNPHNVQALHNQAVIFRIVLKPQMAIEHYKKLLKLNQSYPKLYFNLGCNYFDLNEKVPAINNIKKAIQLKPDYVEAHELLNKKYWEDGDTGNFLQSYEQAISDTPNTPDLIYSYVAMLIMANKKETAEKVLVSHIIKFGRLPSFLHALAVIKSEKNKDSDVRKLLEEAVKKEPAHPRYRIDLANYHITNYEYELATQHLNECQLYVPLNQEILAYQGLVGRLNQNPKSKWLNNYEQFIHAKLIDVPKGYDNLANFLGILREELTKMHGTENQPLDQSVKGGTQTIGSLLSEPVKVIQDFKKVLEQRVSTYLKNLPKDSSHPFLNRNTENFKFSGSWSVLLKDGGFHVNHVHPEGWLSCCIYISVPKEISSEDDTKAGWLKIGETSLELEEREFIGKEICPLEGLCVLFPSYFWHGTNAFSSESNRMTIPCDIMPIN